MRRIAAICVCVLLVGLALRANADQHDGEMQIRQLHEHVYLHTSYARLEGIGWFPSNGLIFVDQRGGSEPALAWIIDSPWRAQDMPKLAAWITEQGWTLTGLISTHFHSDRTAGIDWAKQHDIPTYATRMTNQLLRQQGQSEAHYALQETSFSLAGGKLELYYPGPGHSMDNIVVWLPQQQVLAGGCLVRALEFQGMGNTTDGDVQQWAESINKVAQFVSESGSGEVKTIVPGHGQPGDIRLLEHTLEQIEDHLRGVQ